MKTQRAKFLTGEDRDREAYALARKYLLRFGSQGITDELLHDYLSPPPRDTPSTMVEIFHRLLLSARNRSMMATVIRDEYVELLGPVLDGFDAVKVTLRFASADDLLDTIVKELKPVERFRRAPGSLWPLFTRAILSGAGLERDSERLRSLQRCGPNRRALREDSL